jgi:hypothetical protein
LLTLSGRRQIQAGNRARKSRLGSPVQAVEEKTNKTRFHFFLSAGPSPLSLWLFEAKNHAPPHFHALYAEYEALIDLRIFSVIRGFLPGRAMALVLEWADDHRDELLENWNLCRRMQTPKPIEPLK